MIEIGDIEIKPLVFMRGRILKNFLQFFDEAQNVVDTVSKCF